MFYYMTNFINHHILYIGTLTAKGGILIAKGGTLIEKPYNSQLYDKN